MKNTIFVAMMLSVFPVVCIGGTAEEDFEKMLSRYFDIQTSLAADSTEGIDAAAQSIRKLADNLKSSGEPLRTVAAKVQSASIKIQGKELEEARSVFFEMSKPLLAYLHQQYEGEGKYFRYYCSMANKAWIQPDKDIRNPYHGSSMLTCGELIE